MNPLETPETNHRVIPEGEALEPFHINTGMNDECNTTIDVVRRETNDEIKFEKSPKSKAATIEEGSLGEIPFNTAVNNSKVISENLKQAKKETIKKPSAFEKGKKVPTLNMKQLVDVRLDKPKPMEIHPLPRRRSSQK
mmetsp:Transcript_8523/g.13126  ORF Transcript_8523/g.13126 Transcript_8523/m.13126 type:complete len:138 (-) Transcript_8523:2132-2545(-)